MGIGDFKDKLAGMAGSQAGGFGIGSVFQALRGIEFPIDKASLLQKLKGREKVEWAKDQMVDLKPHIESIPQDTFTSPTEVAQKVGERVHEEVKG
ncbi:MAG: hypothetical protein JWP91_196 [Fibrobacteres bacterium]|nr:hypothetical protein [Fibrobacterota bacterium]